MTVTPRGGQKGDSKGSGEATWARNPGPGKDRARTEPFGFRALSCWLAGGCCQGEGGHDGIIQADPRGVQGPGAGLFIPDCHVLSQSFLVSLLGTLCGVGPREDRVEGPGTTKMFLEILALHLPSRKST